MAALFFCFFIQVMNSTFCVLVLLFCFPFPRKKKPNLKQHTLKEDASETK